MRVTVLLWGLTALSGGYQDGVTPPLVVSVEGPERVIPDGDAVHAVCVVNRGNEEVKGVTVRAFLPPILQYRGRTEGTTLRFGALDLRPGALMRFIFKTRTPAQGTGKLEATAYGATGAVIAGPVARPIQIVKGPVVTTVLEKTGSPVYAGKRHSVTLEIVNPSLFPATGVGVEVPVPPGLEFVSATGPTAFKVEEGKSVRFDPIATMHPADRFTCVLQFKALRPGPVLHSAVSTFKEAPAPAVEERWLEVRPAAPDGSVWIRMAVRSEEGGDGIIPDVAFVDQKPLADGTPVQEGTRQFEVLKKGYQKFTGTIEIADRRQEGVVSLDVALIPRPRLLMVNVQDKNTGAVLAPRVLLVTPGGSSPLQPGDSIKPGTRRIRIEKEGYQDVEEEVVVSPGEEPYVLMRQMVPK